MIERLNTKERYLGRYEIDEEGFVRLGDIARGELQKQAQYIAGFVDRTDPSCYPDLGKSLKMKNIFQNGEGTGNYHEYMIHKDDVAEFLTRVKGYYATR